jgi:N-acetylglucosaminyl-diphospho-decaprenol L-rhamnosyltransferase
MRDSKECIPGGGVVQSLLDPLEVTSSIERRLCVSIVSHGQGRLIEPLLSDLLALRQHLSEVVVTLNIPEDESFLCRASEQLSLRILRNPRPKGFGANHNSAFRRHKGRFFVVVNPDVRLRDFDLEALVTSAASPAVGVAAPLVFSSAGVLQDSARRFPTLARLVRRKLGYREPDYGVPDQEMDVDWVAGMFMVFRREVYETISGFDERFFMYFEDVDLCHRLWRSGLAVRIVPTARITHDARRASRHQLRHFVWHASSACRYFFSR